MPPPAYAAGTGFMQINFNGKLYTGIQIGRGHHWNYDKGDWKETKITPDLWEISYAVTKRRVGHAPEYSGVPTGTEYHWYILAHKRADKAKWSATGPTQRKHLIKFLREFIAGRWTWWRIRN